MVDRLTGAAFIIGTVLTLTYAAILSPYEWLRLAVVYAWAIGLALAVIRVVVWLVVVVRDWRRS